MKTKQYILTCAVLFLTVGISGFAQKRKPTKVVKKAKTVWNYEYYEPGPPIKITTATDSLPKNFSGHDIKKLFDNLTSLTVSAPAKTDAELSTALKGKKILGDLTIDDSFVFMVRVSGSKYGRDVQTKESYTANLYGLNDNSDFEPQEDSRGGCGAGSGAEIPAVKSKDELLDKVFPTKSSDEIWRGGNFQIEEFLPVYDQKSYTGKLFENDEYPDCAYTQFVPSPQLFYQIGFTKKQPYQLVEVGDYVFDLNAYRYLSKDKIGIAAWVSDAPKKNPSNDTDVYFAVRLVPPYVKAGKLVKFDPVEKKNIEAFINQITVDIEGIWAADAATGEILSKEIGQKPVE